MVRSRVRVGFRVRVRVRVMFRVRVWVRILGSCLGLGFRNDGLGFGLGFRVRFQG